MTKQEEKELQTLERLSKLGTMDAGSQARLARLRAASSTNAAAGAQTAAQSGVSATPNIYQQTLAAADPTFSTVNYDNVLKRGVDEGFRVANDDDKALWQQVIAAQNAGDTAAVTSLLNSMRAQGNFSGYYGDDGLWYLVLQEQIPRDRPSPLSFAEEFGVRRRAGATLAYIKEHAACISSSNAVADLAPLA